MDIKPTGLAGDPLNQRVKPLPAKLHVVMPSSIPAESRYLFNCRQNSTIQSLSLPASYHPDMTEILLKKT